MKRKSFNKQTEYAKIRLEENYGCKGEKNLEKSQ